MGWVWNLIGDHWPKQHPDFSVAGSDDFIVWRFCSMQVRITVKGILGIAKHQNTNRHIWWLFLYSLQMLKGHCQSGVCCSEWHRYCKVCLNVSFIYITCVSCWSLYYCTWMWYYSYKARNPIIKKKKKKRENKQTIFCVPWTIESSAKKQKASW